MYGKCLGFVFTVWTMRTAHYIGSDQHAAVFAFPAAGAVNMLSGWSLKAAIAIGRRAAEHAAFFIGIMLMQAVKTLLAAMTEFT